MFGLGLQGMLIILIIALIIFGPAKLPQIGSGWGKAIRDLRKGMKEEELEGEVHEEKTANFALISIRPFLSYNWEMCL